MNPSPLLDPSAPPSSSLPQALTILPQVLRLALLAAVVSAASPALAAPPPAAAAALRASERFTDVPAAHWAAGAVDYVTVRQPMMDGVTGARFGGQVAMTRVMFALTLDKVLTDLEKRSKGSWGATQAAQYDFQDVPDGPQRDAVNRVAGWYRVFDDLPGVDKGRLGAAEPLTRAQMAQALDVLLRRAEERGMMARDRRVPPKAFSDVGAQQAGASAIESLANDFQVVDGYPDGTYKPDAPLTRFQFAAAAAKIFPHVQALIAKTKEPAAPIPTATPTLKPLAATWARRYMEDIPLGLRAELGAGGFQGGAGRMAVYQGILYSQLDVRPTVVPASLHELGLRLGAGYPLWNVFAAQPYLAGRFYGDGTTNAVMAGGGLLMHARPSQRLGLSFSADTGFPVVATATVPAGIMYAELMGGGQLYLTDRLALTAEAVYGTAPSGAAATAVTGLRGSLGLAFRL